MRVLDGRIDSRGRLLLPKEWRKKHSRLMLVSETDEYLKIVPKEKADSLL